MTEVIAIAFLMLVYPIYIALVLMKLYFRHKLEYQLDMLKCLENERRT